MLLECQESCIFNGDDTTKYFELQKGARQGGPTSAYLFILCLEIVFILIKANKRVKGINIFKHTYLYSAYADDTTFFLRDKKSIKEFLLNLLKGQKAPPPPTSFSSVTSTNVGIRPQNFLTFSFNPFDRLV